MDDAAKPTGFESDRLERVKYAERLARYIHALATAPVLPAGRVLAIDAPWGSGKSWIAEKLPAYLASRPEKVRCVYVNAFEFDFHHDPFVVLASAIVSHSQAKGSKKLADFRVAAGDVIRAGLPAVTKGLVKAAAGAIGIDADGAAAKLLDAVGDATENGVDSLLDTFERTNKAATAFKSKLQILAAQEEGPLVVVIDELDRCRPTFALEMLERVKHLFDVPNVVFVLLVHSPALRSTIRCTYGVDIDPRAYLKKFISISVGVPVTAAGRQGIEHEVTFIQSFLESQSGDNRSPGSLHPDFLDAVAVFGPVFKATLRDVQRVVLAAHLVKHIRGAKWPCLLAYALYLHTLDPGKLSKLLAGDEVAYADEAVRFRASAVAGHPAAEALFTAFSDEVRRLRGDPRDKSVTEARLVASEALVSDLKVTIRIISTEHFRIE
jgi:KAP family P-loop domain